MTTALYRRYRPDTFQDVIGQDHVTAPLMAALRADRVTHAYLFSGPRGCGKTTSARILARCLNCEQAPTDSPCGDCPSCRDLATGGPGSLDVVEIDAASHNGVDDARDLRERAAFAPARDRYKIFILDEAHMVTAQGFNALLKLVEEPPAHIKFIFATTEPEKVIGTIRSRTHHYPFRLVPPDVLEAYLGHLCDSEGVRVGQGVFPLVVRAGGGSVRDTLSVMDQLIGGALEGGVDYQRAVALLGYTDTTMLDQCVDAIAAADGSGVFRVVDRVVTSGHDPRRFVEDLLQRLRDLLVIALAGQEAGPALGSLPPDELARMEVQARTMGATALSRAADMTAQALAAMVGATSPRLQLELLMARLLVPAVASSPAQGGSGAGADGHEAQGPTVVVPDPGPARPVTAGTSPPSAPPPAPSSAASAAPRSVGAASAEDHSGGRGPSSGWPARSRDHSGAEDVRSGTSSGWDGSGQPAADREEPASRPEAGAAVASTRQPTGQGADGEQRARQQDHGGAQALGAAEAEMIRTRWEEVLEAAKRSRRATWALVGPNSQPGSLREGVFTLLFTAPGLVGAFENGGHGPIFSAAIHQALGLTVEVHAVLVGDDGPGGTGPEAGGGPGGAPGAGGQGGPGGGGPRAGSGPGRPGSPGGPHAGGSARSAGDSRGQGAAGTDWADWSGGPSGPGAVGASGGAVPRGWPAAPAQPRVDPAPVADDPVPPEGRAGRLAAAQAEGGVVPRLPADGPEEAHPGHEWPGGSGTSWVTSAADGPPEPEWPADPPEEPLLEGPGDPPPEGAARAGLEPETPVPHPLPGGLPSGAPSHGYEGSRAVGGPGAGAPGPPGRGVPAPGDSVASPGDPDDGWGPVAVPGGGAGGSGGGPVPPGASGTPPLPTSSPGPQDAPLAPVHRLHPLPDLSAARGSHGPHSSQPPYLPPGSRGEADQQDRSAHRSAQLAPQSPRGLAPVTWDGSAATVSDRFSDQLSDGGALSGEPGAGGGVSPPAWDREPSPEEPTGPETSREPRESGTWAPAGEAGSRLAAAMAAARAAAQEPGQRPAPAEDTPSEDDEDAEDAGVVGLEVVKRVLGATVIEEVTVAQGES